MNKPHIPNGLARHLDKGRAERALLVERQAIDEEARTATLAFASETPYERLWGIEILDVTATSMRTGRLRSGANLLIDHAMRNPHVPPGFWRGVNLNQNALYLECFLDEVAHATKQDPLALRRKLMARHPKHQAVLDAVAQRAGWGKPAPDVRGQKVFRGLAQTHGFGSYVAACAEVSVSARGELTIHRIVAATDCGHAVNPQQIEAQVEGSFAYGLSALFGA